MRATDKVGSMQHNVICNQSRKLSLTTSPLDWCLNDPCFSVAGMLI